MSESNEAPELKPSDDATPTSAKTTAAKSSGAKNAARFQWGFATGALAILLFLVLFHRVAHIFQTTLTADVAGARQVELPLSIFGAMSQDAIVMALGAGLLILVMLCHKEVMAFFRSIKVGVMIVIFALCACLIGVFIPQLDGMEDPTMRVDLTAQALVDPEDVFPHIERWSGEQLDLIAPMGERQALRLRAHAGDKNLASFVDLPFEIQPPSVDRSANGYIVSVDYGLGRRGGEVSFQIYKRHLKTGAWELQSDALRKLDGYAQRFEGENFAPDTGADQTSEWHFQHQITTSRMAIDLPPGRYVLRATLQPSPLRREVDAHLPTELVLGRVRVEESQTFRKHYEEFAEAEAQLFFYLNNPLRMYGWADPDANLTKEQKKRAQETRKQVEAEIAVLEANADLYQRDSVRNRKKELESGIATVTKRFHVDRDLVRSEDFYRSFFALVTRLDFNLAYKSAWFMGLMTLLFASVLSNTLRYGIRPLFTWQRLGFVTTHLGILITIAGGYFSRVPARDPNGAPTRGILEVSTRPSQSAQRGHRGIRQAEDGYYGHYQTPAPGESKPKLPFKVKLLAFHREDWPGLVIKYPPRTKLQDLEHEVKWIPPAYTLWNGREMAFAYDEEGTPKHQIKVEQLLRRIDYRDKFGLPDPRIVSRERAVDAESFRRPAIQLERFEMIGEESTPVRSSRHLLEPLRSDLPREIGRDRFVLFGGGRAASSFQADGREWVSGPEELRREFALRYAVVKDDAELRALLQPVQASYGRLEVSVRDVAGPEAEQSFELYGAGQVFDLPGGYRIEVRRLFTDLEEELQRIEQGMWQNPMPVAEVYVSSRTSSRSDRRYLTPYTDAGSLGQQEDFHHKKVFVRLDWDAWRTPVDERYVLARRGEDGPHELYRVPLEASSDGALPEPLQRDLAIGNSLAIPSADGEEELRLGESYRSLEQATRLLPNWLIYPARPLAEFEAALDRPQEPLQDVALSWVDVSFLDDADFEAEGVESIYELDLEALAERWRSKGGVGGVADMLAQRAHQVRVPGSKFVQLLGGELAVSELIDDAFAETFAFKQAVNYLYEQIYDRKVDRETVSVRVMRDLINADYAGAMQDSPDQALQIWAMIRDEVLVPFKAPGDSTAFANAAHQLLPYRPGFYDRLPMGAILNIESAGRTERVRLLSTPGKSQDSLRPVMRQEGGDLYLGAAGDLVVYFREQIDKLPFRWNSKIAIVDSDDEAMVYHRGEIRVNEYLKYGGWRFFQTNHDPSDPFYSGIGVVFDPGIPTVSLGMALIILGTFYAFLIKPFIARRLGARS